MKHLESRLKRLETRANTKRQTVVWCWAEADMPSTIDDMIVRGEITEADNREMAVHWKQCKCPPGTHEKRLEELGLI